MVVGLPAAGISALFYLFCVLLMPVRTAWLIARGQALRPGHWRLLATQSVISLGIVAMLFLTGWMLSLVLPGPPSVTADGGSPPTAGGGTAAAAVGTSIGILSAFGLLLALITLATVMVVVQVLAWRAGRRLGPIASSHAGAGHESGSVGRRES